MEPIRGRMSRLTLQFAQAVCSTLNDMFDMKYTEQERTFRDEPFSTAQGTIAFIHFGGTVQGDCIIVISQVLCQ